MTRIGLIRTSLLSPVPSIGLCGFSTRSVKAGANIRIHTSYNRQVVPHKPQCHSTLYLHQLGNHLPCKASPTLLFPRGVPNLSYCSLPASGFVACDCNAAFTSIVSCHWLRCKSTATTLDMGATVIKYQSLCGMAWHDKFPMQVESRGGLQRRRVQEVHTYIRIPHDGISLLLVYQNLKSCSVETRSFSCDVDTVRGHVRIFQFF